MRYDSVIKQGIAALNDPKVIVLSTCKNSF